MADTIQFDLVSPESKLLSAQATEVQIPGAEGDMTAMAGHVPTITTLRPGVLKVLADGQAVEFAVTGGFAEISADAISVLAEQALPREEVTQDVLNAWVADAHRSHASAKQDNVADAAKLLADMVALGGHIGLEAQVPTS